VIGTITDATGAVIPGATVTIKEAATGRTVNTQTNDAGQYVLSALPIGKYHLDVKQEGFKTSFADFSLEVSQVLEVSLKLGTGSTSTAVEVSGEVTCRKLFALKRAALACEQGPRASQNGSAHRRHSHFQRGRSDSGTASRRSAAQRPQLRNSGSFDSGREPRPVFR